MSKKVIGVDGCKGGWVAVVRDLESRESACAVFGDFRGLMLFAGDTDAIAVDIPIGFLDAAQHGGRPCDIEARKLLGGSRASSVFSPPVRATLAAGSYSAALRINRASSAEGIGISKQCFAIIAKMREVDALMTPTLQERVREVHPELCFRAMNDGDSLSVGKRTKEGQDERYGLLWDQGYCVPDELLTRWPKSLVAPDDILDAHAACWTAERILKSEAVQTPPTPEIDAKGLRMKMWF